MAPAPLPTVMIPDNLATVIRPTSTVSPTPTSSPAPLSSPDTSNTIRMNILIGSAMVIVFVLALVCAYLIQRGRSDETRDSRVEELMRDTKVTRTPTLPLYRRREDGQEGRETGEVELPEAMRRSPLPPYLSPMDYVAADLGRASHLRNIPSTNTISSTS
ncbi:hypothetical protein BJ742DRAFT_812823 [Cladochytrium replicatum]|nr:hypothetical protein BJ742DRAFT_812823 [Cladochytrium replicatum]